MKEIEIKEEGRNIGFLLKDDGKIVDWNELSKLDKLDFLNMIREAYDFFQKIYLTTKTGLSWKNNWYHLK